MTVDGAAPGDLAPVWAVVRAAIEEAEEAVARSRLVAAGIERQLADASRAFERPDCDLKADIDLIA